MSEDNSKKVTIVRTTRLLIGRNDLDISTLSKRLTVTGNLTSWLSELGRRAEEMEEAGTIKPDSWVYDEIKDTKEALALLAREPRQHIVDTLNLSGSRYEPCRRCDLMVREEKLEDHQSECQEAPG